MNKLSPACKAAHDALTLLGKARDEGNKDAYNLAYDSYMRALRDMDIESFDADVVDDYGNVMKSSGKFGHSSSSKRAWEHVLPEDG